MSGEDTPLLPGTLAREAPSFAAGAYRAEAPADRPIEPYSLVPRPARKQNQDPFVPMVIPKSRQPPRPNKEGYVDPLLIACDQLWDEIEQLWPRLFELEYLGDEATPEQQEERARLDFRVKKLRAYSEFYRTIVIDYEWRKANPKYAGFPKFFRF